MYAIYSHVKIYYINVIYMLYMMVYTLYYTHIYIYI